MFSAAIIGLIKRDILGNVAFQYMRRVHAFPLHSIQFPFQSQRQCNTSCHVEAHDGVAKGAGAEKGGDGNGGVSGGGGDDGDNDDNNNDVFDEAANQLSRSKLEQYDCKTLFTRTLLIKHH
nr:hypothetical transcript [Hymenolepis microstoma]